MRCVAAPAWPSPPPHQAPPGPTSPFLTSTTGTACSLPPHLNVGKFSLNDPEGKERDRLSVTGLNGDAGKLCCVASGATDLTFEDSQVMLSFQKGQSLSHCGHMTIWPPMSGLHTSLLKNGGNV